MKKILIKTEVLTHYKVKSIYFGSNCKRTNLNKGTKNQFRDFIAGRYLVLVPFSDRISISQKIESKEEKERLKRLVRSITPKGFGVIIELLQPIKSSRTR